MSDLPCQTPGAVPRLAQLDSFTRLAFSTSSAKVETGNHPDRPPTPVGHLHAKTARLHRAPSRSCGGASKMRGESRARRGVASDEGPSLQSPPGKVHLWPPAAHLPRFPSPEGTLRRTDSEPCPSVVEVSSPRPGKGRTLSGLWFFPCERPDQGRGRRRADSAPPPRKAPHWPRDLTEGPFSLDLPCRRRELCKVNTHKTDTGQRPVEGRKAESALPPRKVPHWPRDLAEGPFSLDLPCKRRELGKCSSR